MPVLFPQPGHLLTRSGQVGAQLSQHVGGHAVAFPDEAEQDVLAADIRVTETVGFPQRQLQRRFRPGVNRMCPEGACSPRSTDSSTRCRMAPGLISSDSRTSTARPSLTSNQSQQEVLGTNVVMVQPSGLVLGVDHNEPRPFGKSLEHRPLPPFAFIPRCADAEDGPR